MTRKKYMTVVEAVQYLLGKDEDIEAGTIESINYENGNLTFTFKNGSTQTINITTEPLEVEDIEALTDEELENLKAGDIVLKLTNDMKHTYIVTYKEDGVGICLSYFDYGYTETVSYDYDSEVEAWTLNDVERLNIKQELDDLKSNKQDKLTAGSGITIDPETNEISSDGVTYTAGANINIDENNEISCTVDTSNFVEKLVPTGTSDIYNQFRTEIEREIYTYSGHENAKGIRNKAYQRVYLAGQMHYAETYLGTENTYDYELKELIFDKNGTPSYTDATNVAYRILKAASLTESINNKYKKVYDTSNDSYNETFKYTDSNNITYTVTREPFKYVASDIALSSNVSVSSNLYEVITITAVMNNATVYEYTIYNSLINSNYSKYESINLIPMNTKIVKRVDMTGIGFDIYTYDTSTTPETLVQNKTYKMPNTDYQIVEHNIVITNALPTTVDGIRKMNTDEYYMFKFLNSSQTAYSSIESIARELYNKGHTDINTCIVANGRASDDDFACVDASSNDVYGDVTPVGVYATQTESGGVYTYHLYAVLRSINEDSNVKCYGNEISPSIDYTIDTVNILLDM